MQIERQESSILKSQNKRWQAEKFTAVEAMYNLSCKICGGPTVLGETNSEEVEVRTENSRLWDELERISTLAGKFMGRPLSSMVNITGRVDASTVPSQGYNQQVGASNNSEGNVGVDESLQRSMSKLAMAAMNELMKVAQMGEPLWMKDGENGREALNFEEYGRRFVRCIGPKQDEYVLEASRESGVVVVNSFVLVEALMDAHRWAEIFPNLIAKATTTDIISSGMDGTRNGALQLMQASLQVLSPLVPTREVRILRFCKQHANGIWAIVDVSCDGIHEFPTMTNGNTNCRRLPSGCIFQDMPSGHCKVTWVEHSEYDESRVNSKYRPLLKSSLGLGAHRWLATIQRQCEFLAFFVPSIPNPADQNAMPTNGKRSTLKLAQRMTRIFCSSVCMSSSPSSKWRKVSPDDGSIHVMTRDSITNPGEPLGTVLCAATTISLPVGPQHIFDFLRDHNERGRWDIMSNGGPMQRTASILKGWNPGNAVSVLSTSVGSTTMVLEETCVDASGALVVYAPVDVTAMQRVMNGGDSAHLTTLPSGFSIVPDGAGSLLTVAFQILLNSELCAQSVEMVKNLMASTLQKIKDVLTLDN